MHIMVTFGAMNPVPDIPSFRIAGDPGVASKATTAMGNPWKSSIHGGHTSDTSLLNIGGFSTAMFHDHRVYHVSPV